jgi:ketosteroid isomerase-like protein
MTAVDDRVDELIEQFHLVQDEFVNGNPEPVEQLFSHREDVTTANPRGPAVRGWEQVAQTMARAASNLREGEIVGFENVAKHVTPELAYIVEIEQLNSKVGAREEVSPFTLRVTTIFGPEEGTWKVVHRRADPITTPQPAESVIQE